uniref:Uncharacterized protein n=1 Tax=Anguilla anguilla TaxID=7936 RepID=A0A0E9XLK9_ANGAN
MFWMIRMAMHLSKVVLMARKRHWRKWKFLSARKQVPPISLPVQMLEKMGANQHQTMMRLLLWHCETTN